jgi:parallel beta-helix repeat protein
MTIRSGMEADQNSKLKNSLRWISVFLVSLLGLGEVHCASVRDFGAKGDGQNNDTAAFEAALSSKDSSVVIPSGKYLLGPHPLVIPEGVVVSGVGSASCILPVAETTTLFTMMADSQIRDISVNGKNVKKGSYNDDGVILARKSRNLLIQNVSFLQTDRVCLTSDKSEELTIRDCLFRQIGMAVHIDVSHRISLINNRIFDASLHGVEIWGCLGWKEKACSDIIITGNYVKNGGRGAIWGVGIKRVIMANNIVDGALDVGLDLEWCEDATISGNVVSRCYNAGISLFFSCERVSITGNTIINDYPISEEDAKADWWVRSGIWLTDPNRKEFPADNGHRDVTITGNAIFCAEGPGRRAIWIGAESKNITIGLNVLNGGKIVGEGLSEVKPLVLREIPDNVQISHTRQGE